MLIIYCLSIVYWVISLFRFDSRIWFWVCQFLIIAYHNWAATWENQQCGFWPGLTQTRLYNYWRWLEAWNFVFRKKRYCTIQVAKTKALISFAVTAKLICVFVFAYAERWFFYDAAQILNNRPLFIIANTHISYWSTELTSTPGKGVTSDPVGYENILVETFSSVPSFLNTVTSLGPVILPWPFMCVTWNI